MWFHDKGRRRDYLILHRPAKGNKSGKKTPARWWARSLADAGVVGELDLRDRQHAKALAGELLQLDLATLVE
jgi:hypothetical protein